MAMLLAKLFLAIEPGNKKCFNTLGKASDVNDHHFSLSSVQTTADSDHWIM